MCINTHTAHTHLPTAHTHTQTPLETCITTTTKKPDTKDHCISQSSKTDSPYEIYRIYKDGKGISDSMVLRWDSKHGRQTGSDC